MNREIVHKLVGYDRHTEWVAFEAEIPRKHLGYAKARAKVSPQDSDAVGCYPLSWMNAHDIAGVIGCRLPRDLDYFLEAFARTESSTKKREFA